MERRQAILLPPCDLQIDREEVKNDGPAKKNLNIF